MSDSQYADYYRCCTRTIARMRAANVDLADPVAVAVVLIGLKNPAPAMVARTIEILEDEQTD